MFSEACNLQGVCIVGESGEGGMDKEREEGLSPLPQIPLFLSLFYLQSLPKSLGDSDFQPQRPGSASSSDRSKFVPYTPQVH